MRALPTAARRRRQTRRQPRQARRSHDAPSHVRPRAPKRAFATPTARGAPGALARCAVSLTRHSWRRLRHLPRPQPTDPRPHTLPQGGALPSSNSPGPSTDRPTSDLTHCPKAERCRLQTLPRRGRTRSRRPSRRARRRAQPRRAGVFALQVDSVGFGSDNEKRAIAAPHSPTGAGAARSTPAARRSTYPVKSRFDSVGRA
jgi:hypothetical protein